MVQIMYARQYAEAFMIQFTRRLDFECYKYLYARKRMMTNMISRLLAYTPCVMILSNLVANLRMWLNSLRMSRWGYPSRQACCAKVQRAQGVKVDCYYYLGVSKVLQDVSYV